MSLHYDLAIRLTICYDHRNYNSQIKSCLTLMLVFVLANSVDPDEMPQDVAFHLGLHCVPKNAFRIK